MAEAKVRLSVDGVQSVVTGFKQVGAEVREAAGSMSVLSAIAGSLSVSGLASMVRGAINAVDNLGDLSEVTSIAASDLAGLKWAAQLSGTDLDTVAKGVNKLATEMGKDAEKFAAIGVTAKEPIEAFKQFADVFASIKDPQERAAFGAAALGRQWEVLAPILSRGGQQIGEMVDRGRQLYGVTDEMVEASGKFNDRLDELSAAMEGVRNRLAADLLPLLTVLTSDLEGTATNVSQLDGAFNPLTETLRAVVVLGGNVAFVFKGVGTEIGAIMAQMGVLAGVADLINPVNAALEAYYVAAGKPSRLKAAWEDFNRIGDMAKADAEERRRAFDEWEKSVMQAGRTTAAGAAAADSELARLANRSNAANAARVRAFLEGEEKRKKATAEARKEEEARARLMAELSGVNGDYMEQLSRLDALRRSGNVSEARYVELVTELIGKQPGAKKLMEEEAKAFGDVAKAGQEAAAAYEKFLADLVDGLDKMRQDVQAQQDYNDRIGLSRQAIAALDAAKLEEQATTLEGLAIKKLDRDLDVTQYNLYKQQADELRKLAQLKRDGADKEGAVEQQEKIAVESQKIWDNFAENVQRNLGDGLYNAMQGNFKGIGDSFKQMLMRMLADAAAANISQVLMGTSGGGSGSGLLGALFNAGVSIFGGGLTVDTAGMGISDGASVEGLAARDLLRGGRAGGGRVDAGTLVPVNELGTEVLSIGSNDYLMMGAQPGYVTPSRPAAGKTIHITSAPVINVDARTDKAEVERIVLRAVQRGNAQLEDLMYREEVN